MLIHVTFNGTSLDVYLDGVSIGAAANVIPYVLPAASIVTAVGDLPAEPYPAVNEHVYALGGGNYVVSAAEALQHYKDFVSAGRATQLVGKTDHHYDLTQDIAPDPDAGIPAQVLDRVGVDHLTRVGGLRVTTVGAAVGLRGYDLGFYAAASDAGLIGANEFWAGALLKVDAITGNRIPMGFTDLGAKGWFLFFSNNICLIRAFDSVGQKDVTYVFDPVVGQLADVRFRISAGLLSLWVNGIQRGTAIAIGALVTATTSKFTFGPQLLGASYPCPDISIFGGGGGAYTVSNAEILAAANASLSSGVFTAIPSKTGRLYTFGADISEASGKVPMFHKERALGTDHMPVMGAPLQVAERTERLWSYEAAPILYGTAPLDTTSKYIACAGGTAGTHQSGVWWALLLVVTSQATVGVQHLAGKRDSGATTGWGVVSSVNNTQLAARLSTTANSALAGGVAAVAAGDVGKILLLGCELDCVSGHLRTYYRRAQIATGVSLAGGTYLPAASACMFGPPSAGTISGIRMLGLMCGRGIPGLARWQAAHDAAQAREDLIAIPGYTEHLWSLTQSCNDNGGVMPASVVDRIGTDHMTVYGGLTAEGHFARAWGW
jgi:hypothetical protein